VGYLKVNAYNLNHLKFHVFIEVRIRNIIRGYIGYNFKRMQNLKKNDSILLNKL
jgi:hypothetical protein